MIVLSAHEVSPFAQPAQVLLDGHWTPVVALPRGRRTETSTPGRWIASWACAQQVPEPQNALAPEDGQDATLRQVIHLSLGGQRLRVHVSNAFGTQPLHLTAVHVALAAAAGSSSIVPGSDHALLFAGQADVIVPPGAEYISDALDYPARPSADLTLSMHLDQLPTPQTGHPGSRATSYLVHGESTGAATFVHPKTVEHWYMLSGVDVWSATGKYSVVALGDSITDGHGATTNGNDRWTDVLARHVAQDVGILNLGIGGNHMLTDGLGPNVLARLDRDVLAQAGVRTVLLFEGVNDLGALSREGEQPAASHATLVQRITGSYAQVIERAHAQGLRVLGATITPDMGSDYYHPAAANEADRQQVNQWIRAAGHFDAVIDFDRLVADPAHPDRLLPAYDSGDHLHPSPAGYRVMGEAVAPGVL